MGYGLTNHLLALCGGVFAACYLIAWRRLPWSWAAALAGIRVFIPLIYFAWYYDGQWTILDDLVYFDHGQILLEQGFTPLSILTQEGRHTVFSLVGSEHILYGWWNFLVMWFFGPHYYVSVIVNVGITFLSGHLFSQLAAEIGYSRNYQRLLHAFYLLHWETIAWSSFVSIKDTIVQCMTIGFFLCAIRAMRRHSWSYVAIGVGLLLAFLHLRFYVPFLVGAAAAAWVFLEWRDVRKYPLLAGGLLIGIWFVPGRGYELLESISLFDTSFGITRFVLTPQPWSVQEDYSYLVLPATLHWVMILPAVAGGLMLWRESPAIRFVLLYALILIFMYALADEIQGARQRFQLSFIFAWAQMHFLWRWTHTSSHGSVPVPQRPRQATPLAARAV